MVGADVEAEEVVEDAVEEAAEVVAGEETENLSFRFPLF